MRTNIAAAGSAAMPIAMRQSRASVAPTIVESTIPTPIPTWKVSTRRPRTDAGASSATYMGTTCVPPPTAKPSRIRLSERVHLSGATEQAIAPTKKITAMTRMVPRRPRISDTRLQVSAPMIAPSRMLAALSCFHVLPMS